MKGVLCFLGLLLAVMTGAAQTYAAVQPNIKTTQLYKRGDQTAFPALILGSNDALELHFDDMDGDVKNYSYTFQLCNWDWTPSMLTPFEYIKGFQQVRITNYRTSSIALSRYTHYQAPVPDRNSTPSRSGNYLLKVFANGDTSRLAFTKRFVVVDMKTVVAAQVQQPFNAQFFRTHQKLQIVVNTDTRTRIMSPQDVKVVVLQNNNWQTASFMDRPTIYRGNYYEYSDEDLTAMPAGKEWRWIDVRSYRLMSDRMQHLKTTGDTAHVFVKPDADRTGQSYVYYRDLNGAYAVEALENINPLWQADYGYVHFTYFPPANHPFAGRDLYLFGQLTNYGLDTTSRMVFNSERGAYEKTLYLKQGFYNYTYVTQSKANGGYPDFSQAEGNYWGTENNYIVLVYHRPFGARADELIGYTALSSVFQRAGF